MKKIVCFLCVLLVYAGVYAQQGVLKESISMSSKIMGTNVKYSVYLPPDYGLTNRSYPVLYLLHGYTDDETAWVQFGEASSIADKLIQSGTVPPMIIVMPDGGVSFYLNSYDGKTKYEDFMVQEFIPFVDANYRTRTKREFRAVAGLSMGGYGSLLLSMKHPDLFVAAAPLSAAVLNDDEVTAIPEKDWNYVWGGLMGKDLKGKDRLNTQWYQNSIIKIAETTPLNELKKVAYYIDCGDDDFLIKGNMSLHAVLTDRKVPHEFRVRDGAHNWTYWRTALPAVLQFVGDRFHR